VKRNYALAFVGTYYQIFVQSDDFPSIVLGQHLGMIADEDETESVTYRLQPEKPACQKTASLKKNGNVGGPIYKIYIIVNDAVYPPSMHPDNILSGLLHRGMPPIRLIKLLFKLYYGLE
jgi:hypothetical protein